MTYSLNKLKLKGLVIKIGSGATPSGGGSSYSKTGTSLIRSQNVLDFVFSIDGLARINNDQANKLNNVIVESEDVLLNITGDSVARVCQVPNSILPARVNQHVAIIRTQKTKLYPGYLKYYLLSPIMKSSLLSLSSAGATRKALTKRMIEELEVEIPSLQYQISIAEILSSLDDKIELNLQMSKTLEAIAQAIFKEWFVDFRFPGFDGELVEGLPKGWLMRKLNQVAQVEIGRTPPRMENQWFSIDNKDIKWISIRDMGNSGIFIFNTSEYLTSAAIEKFRIPVIPHDTVVLSFKLTIGRVVITTERMVSNEAIAQIKSDTLDSGFIYCLLKNYHFDSLGSTSSIATAINSKIIKEMEVLVPEQKVVDEFCRIVGPVFNKIKNNSLEIKTVTEIRDLLLPKLMTGKIKVA